MAELIDRPVRVEAAGEPPKMIDEFAGSLRVETEEGGALEVRSGQGVLVRAGDWVRYSTPEGAEYMSVCVPAFSPHTVHRDDE